MEPTDANRRAWNALHGHGTRARVGLPPIVRQTLGDLGRKRVLHLHCRTGEGAAELAELGAVVTAIDASPEALDAARERWPSILWVEGEIHALPGELRRRRYDLVFSPEGTLARAADLQAWSRGVAGALAARGELLMYDEHPVAECVDGLLRWRRQSDICGGGRLWQRAGIVSGKPGFRERLVDRARTTGRLALTGSTIECLQASELARSQNGRRAWLPAGMDIYPGACADRRPGDTLAFDAHRAAMKKVSCRRAPCAYDDGSDAATNYALSESAARRALEINPELPIAHQMYAHLEVSTGRARDAMLRLLDRVARGSNDPNVFA